MKYIKQLLCTFLEILLMPVFILVQLGIIYTCLGLDAVRFGQHFGNLVGSIACCTVYMGFIYSSENMMKLYKKQSFWMIMLIFNLINQVLAWVNYIFDSMLIKFIFTQGDWYLALGLKQQFVFIVSGIFGTWFQGIWPDVSAAAKGLFCYIVSWCFWIIFAKQVVRFNSNADLSLPNEYFIISGLIQSMNFIHYTKNTILKVYKYQFRNLVEQIVYTATFTLILTLIQYFIVYGFSTLFYPQISKLLRVENVQNLISLVWLSNNLLGRHIGPIVWDWLYMIKNQNLRLIPYIVILWLLCVPVSFICGFIFHFLVFDIIIMAIFKQQDLPNYMRPDFIFGVCCGNFVLLYDGIQANCGGFWKVKREEPGRPDLESDADLIVSVT